MSSLYTCIVHAQTRTVSEQYLVTAVNQARAERGLSPLRFDASLARAALTHAQSMAAHRSISHQFPGEPDLATRAGNAGARFSLVTENVAEASNSALIHELWMRSAGHRANLLDPNVDSLGVAVVAFRGQLYAVQDFAHTTQAISLGEQEARVAQVVAGLGTAIGILADSTDARGTCQLSSGYVGNTKPRFVVRYTTSDLSLLPDELRAKILSGHFRTAAIGACAASGENPFTGYLNAVLLYP